MPTWYKALLACCIGLSLAGCTVGTDEVLFVTATNIGIDADSKPPNLAIAYDRTEGYIGPSYDNGALPPVMSRIQSNLSIIDPAVRQIYATGDASVLLSQPNAVALTDRPLTTRNKRVAYFLTQSSIGLKVTFAETVPDSVHLGYKRKEFSYIPIGTSDKGPCRPPAKSDGAPAVSTTPAPPVPVDCYASVLASIEMGGKISDPEKTGLQIDQFFATGLAAEHLAAESEEIRTLFHDKLYASDIAAKYQCDTNCEKLKTFAKEKGKTGREALQTQCTAPAKIKRIFDLIYLPQHKTDRQTCVTTLHL